MRSLRGRLNVSDSFKGTHHVSSPGFDPQWQQKFLCRKNNKIEQSKRSNNLSTFKSVVLKFQTWRLLSTKRRTDTRSRLENRSDSSGRRSWRNGKSRCYRSRAGCGTQQRSWERGGLHKEIPETDERSTRSCPGSGWLRTTRWCSSWCTRPFCWQKFFWDLIRIFRT